MLHRVGRFPLDPTTLPTYELHLTLTEDRTIKVSPGLIVDDEHLIRIKVSAKLMP